MEQALRIHDHDDDRAEADARQGGEVIDAFDHVLETLDEILILMERAFPRDVRDSGH